MFGVAVLASIFAHYGGYGSGASFVDGLTPAIWVGAVVVAVGALAALLIPRRRRPAEVGALRPVWTRPREPSTVFRRDRPAGFCP